MARILIIEDNQDNLALMTYLLKAFGHEAQSARDGIAGLGLARCGTVDLIVCDVHLPKIDGYEIARRLRLEPAFRTPLIAVTALAMVGDRDKVLAAGFDGYISKPIEPTTFVGEIEAYLPATNFEVSPLAAFGGFPGEGQALGTEIARILVVDDSPVNHQLTRALLAPFGYRLTFAMDAESALAHLRQADVDLVISDLHMPGDDGLALLARIRYEASWQETPVMLISSSAHGDADARRAMELGASCFLLRPIDPVLVLEAVRRSLAGAKDAH